MSQIEIKKENIVNKENIINDTHLLEDISTSDITNCVFKLKFKIEKDGKSELKTGTGFVCSIPDKDGMKIFLTNNHILNKEYLDKEEKLILYNNKDEKKEINLKLTRYKYTNEEFDFTIIELLEEDNISKYLEIDDYIDSTDYKDEKICSFQYQQGQNLKYSYGDNYGKKDNYFLYSVGELGGSSGSPLILINNKKVIGLHKAGYTNEEQNKINLGIPLNLILNKIKLIKCIYNIKKNNIGKEIQIIKSHDYGDKFNEIIN